MGVCEVDMRRDLEGPVRSAAAQHIVNVSGGKDSQACAILAARRGRPFRLVMADTGHEHEATIEHAQYVAEFVGQPLEIVRADFSRQIARKREFVAAEWPAAGVPLDRVQRALEVLQPTGNPFLDLCIWKGRFPSRMAQFCTEFLKSRAVEQAVIGPALETGPVVQWLGVRRDESLNRRHLPMFQRVRRADAPHDMLFFRPLIDWNASEVFDLIRRSGMRNNPLYLQGMGRVGCFPCINENKHGLAEIGRRFLEAVEKLLEWEALVRDASKRGAATFFAADTTPEGAALVRQVKADAERITRRLYPEVDRDSREWKAAFKRQVATLSADAPLPRADQVFEWAKTDRGGRQYKLLDLAFSEEGVSCSSQYGLCE